MNFDDQLSLSTFDVVHATPPLDGLISDLIEALLSIQETSSVSLSTTPMRVAVACSGGCDSMALAHAICLISRHSDHRSPDRATRLLVEPVILTVDHQLHERSHDHATGVVDFWRGLDVEAHHLRADLSMIQGGFG